ncbi:MAG: hypothetical protein GXO70_01715 [Acidobacteria bacterium]|nr:hypothetical protein [Acidobacteriota bacterium]
MRKLVTALLFLLTLVPAAAEKNILCGGVMLNRPVFLVADGKDVSLEGLDGEILFRESNVLAVDIADSVGLVFLKADTLIRLDETFQRHEVKISKLSPLLSLIQEPVHLSLIEPGLLLIPAEVPILMNTHSGLKRPFPGAFRSTEGSLKFGGMNSLWSSGDWVVFQEGEVLVIAAKASLENRLTVPLQHSSVADIWLEGKAIQIRLQNRTGYSVDPLSKTSIGIPKNKNDKVLIRQHVRFWNDTSDSIVELRLKDDGPLSLMSAWKVGKMKAEISVIAPGKKPVRSDLSFSIKTLGKFRFTLRYDSGTLVLDFHEKDIIVTKEAGKVHFFTIPEGQPYAVAGGVVYSWDSLRGTAKRCRLSERQD